jgi:hypothetical protein
MGWVDKQVEDAVDFVTQDIPSKIEDEIIEPTKELGSSIDDFVNEEIPGGWYTVAAATGAYFAPEIAAAMGTEAGAAGAAAASADAGAGAVAAPAPVLATKKARRSRRVSTSPDGPAPVATHAAPCPPPWPGALDISASLSDAATAATDAMLFYADAMLAEDPRWWALRQLQRAATSAQWEMGHRD